jgi:hypothetical protein
MLMGQFDVLISWFRHRLEVAHADERGEIVEKVIIVAAAAGIAIAAMAAIAAAVNAKIGGLHL